jgi:anti-sigma factor RsiW
MASSPDHITCEELVEQVTEYLDGALSAEETELLEQHVNFCEGCDWYLDEMRRTIATGSQLREVHVPEKVLEPLLTAFRERRQS